MIPDPFTALIILKVVHVISAALWIGSIVSLSLAVRFLRNILGSNSVKVSAELGRRLRPLTRASLYSTLASGLLLATQRGFLTDLSALLQQGSATIALAKALLGLTLLLMVNYHSALGEKVARALGPESATATRRRLIYVGWSTVGVSVALAVLGTMLRFR
ncbi:hypothetical protein HRbin02_01187 [Candidatus Calditenuaceae archaeon HR02]|nr:hypothetical protein HRbin02_01187 [Candidatus Calditenuaceae archaeon HR02]